MPIINKILMYILFKATQIARENNQVVGEKNDYYITLAELEEILKIELIKISQYEKS